MPNFSTVNSPTFKIDIHLFIYDLGYMLGDISFNCSDLNRDIV